MILDLLSQSACYYAIGSQLATRLELLPKTDLSALGNWQYEIDGESIYAMVPEYLTQ